MTETRWVENTPHVDEERMRQLDGVALGAQLSSGVMAVRDRWADSARVGADLVDWSAWAYTVQEEGAADAVTAPADALETSDPNWLGRGMGRSQLYGHHYLGWLGPLVDAFALTGDPAYARRWAEVMRRWVTDRDAVAGRIQGLDVIWYSLGIGGRAMHLLDALRVFAVADDVDDGLWADLLAHVVAGARWSAEEHATFRHGNWQLVAVASLLRVGHLLPEHPEAAHWREVGRARLLDHLERDAYADGGHFERAPGYHVLSLTALQNGARMDAARGEFALRDHPRLGAMHDWLLTMSTPGGWVFPVNDAPVMHPGETFAIGWHLLPDGPVRDRLAWAARRWLEAGRLRVLSARLDARGLPPGRPSLLDAPAQAPASLGCELTTSRFAILRDGWEETSMTALLNAGPTIGHELDSHSHRAVLDVTLALGGTPLVWEAGGPTNYDVDSYLSWFQAGRAHSTVIPDSGDRVPEAGAVTEAFTATSDLEAVTALAPDEDGRGAHRRTLLAVHPATGPRYWVLRDEVIPGAVPETWTWLLHSLAPWAPVDAGEGAHVWRSRDPERAAGMTVAVVGAHCATSVAHGARVPEEAGSAHDLHTLFAALPVGAGSGLDAVVVPEAGARKLPAPVVTRDGDLLLVRFGEVVDEIDATGWRRRSVGDDDPKTTPSTNDVNGDLP